MPPKKKVTVSQLPGNPSHIHPNLLLNSISPLPNPVITPNTSISNLSPIFGDRSPAVSLSPPASISSTDLICLGQVLATTGISGALTPTQTLFNISNSTLPSPLTLNSASALNIGSQQASIPSLNNTMNQSSSASVPAKQ
ncbi:hypothetical protein DFH28DRAFT_1119233 [Melampsora americana]|nr:hypothetical protein DFH28DRAFT_1119233 [Melampsora americana]